MLQVSAVAAGAPSAAVPAVLTALSEAMAASPHVEFLLTWVQALCLRPDVAQKVQSVSHACCVCWFCVCCRMCDAYFIALITEAAVLPLSHSSPAHLTHAVAKPATLSGFCRVCDYHPVHAMVQGLQPSAAPALRGLQKVLSQLHDDLAGPCDDNLYTLRYIAAAKPAAAAAVAGVKRTAEAVIED